MTPDYRIAASGFISSVSIAVVEFSPKRSDRIEEDLVFYELGPIVECDLDLMKKKSEMLVC